MALLSVEHVKKIYVTRLGGAKVQALADVDFTVEQGEFAAIMGESGSGKTTLLNILAGLDKPTGGQVFLHMRNICTLGEKEISAFRRDNLGFVFQDFNLLDTFSIQDNIFLPLVLAGKKFDEMHTRLEPIARGLGITDILQKFPYEVSGGQKQRTAIARAIITQPQLILADEPTGALDSRSAGQIMDIFEDINRQGQTVLMVTHSIQAASRAGRVLFIKDGQVFHQIYRGGMDNDQMYQKISDTLTVLATGGEPTAEGVQAPRSGEQARQQRGQGVFDPLQSPETESLVGLGEAQGLAGGGDLCRRRPNNNQEGFGGEAPMTLPQTRSVEGQKIMKEGFGGGLACRLGQSLDASHWDAATPQKTPASPRHLEAPRGQEEGGATHG